jgi:3-oxoacyl-[acyl-carrier protein] reductase
MNQQARKVAIVTGASRGIGAAVAERLAKDGFAVVISYSAEAAPAEALARKIEAAGGRALSAKADVSDPAAVRRMFDSVEVALGGVDVLVNNAGIMQLAAIADADDAFFDRHIAVNLKGTFNTLREAARRVRDGGRIINFSSSVVRLYQPTYVVYAATKAGVEAMTMSSPGAARPQHHRQCRSAWPHRDLPVPQRQAAGRHRPPRQARAAGAPRPAGGHRQHRRLPCRA